MKSNSMTCRVAALTGLLALTEAAHIHGHSYHKNHSRDASLSAQKRGGQCQFPTDAGLVAITPDSDNAGWAMSPDQSCTPGHWCPYACPPGQVSMQWNPDATSYTYPLSMDGGLYCDDNGNMQKPFPDNDYCVDATGAVSAVNKASKALSFCQTVLPGNEAMLIPTLVEDSADLAVPGPSYWCSTAAHYYINPPGTGVEGCIWGTNANPIGNWAYFVAGANTDSTGNTYVKIGYNPVVQEASTPFRDTPATFGVEITCDDDAGCNGLPCKIDPSVNALNEVTSSDSFDGAGGAASCVVTVPKGKSAKIEIFEAGSSGSSDSTSSPSPSPSPSQSSSSTSSATSSSHSTSSVTRSSSSTTPTSTATPTTTSHVSASPATSPAVNTSVPHSESPQASPTPSASPSTTPSGYSYAPHVFVETSSSQGASVATASGDSSLATAATTTASASPSSGASQMPAGSLTSLAFCLIAGIVMHF